VAGAGGAQFVVGSNGAELVLDTYNPTNLPGDSVLFGTHAKSLLTFQPTATSTVVLTARIQLTQNAVQQPGLVVAAYFYGCSGACNTHHDEIDIEIVTKRLQGQPLQVQLNRYANEGLGAGHGRFVSLPAGFDITQPHDWTIRWSRSRIDYLVDGVLLGTETTFVPQGQMHADVIVWGPSAGWPDAYDASLQPVTNPASNRRFEAYVRRMDVRIIP
jgi:beta-glucanase (GH16 family)